MVLICIFFVCVMCVGNDYEYEAVMHDSPDGSITVVENRYNDRDEYYLQKDINIGVAVLRKEILIDRTDTASNVLWSDSESFYIGERLFYTGKILSLMEGDNCEKNHEISFGSDCDIVTCRMYIQSFV